MYQYLCLSKHSDIVCSFDRFGVSDSGIKTDGVNTCVALVLTNLKKTLIAHISPNINLDDFEKSLSSYIDKNGFNCRSEALIVGSCDKENFGQAIVNKMRDVLTSKKIKASELTSQKNEYSTSIYCDNKDVFICHCNINKDFNLSDYLNSEISCKDDLKKLYSNIKIIKPRDAIFYNSV